MIKSKAKVIFEKLAVAPAVVGKLVTKTRKAQKGKKFLELEKQMENLELETSKIIRERRIAKVWGVMPKL